MAKTVAIGGKNYKAGSKRANEAVAAGGKIDKSSSAVRANADASKARTSARNASDPLTVAENMGIDVPDRIEAEEMPGVVAGLEKQGAVATPLAPEIPTTPAAPTAPITAPTGGTPAGVAPAPTPTQSRYQQALAALKGTPAPSDGGAAMRALSSAVPPAPTETTAVDNFISEDPAINSLMANIATLLNPAQQTSTLMQDYKKLYKQSGLDEINEELIDAETVINGTEDDIRNEIQTAGGFGTESQVQALSLARNKGLLKRYNQLVQMKTDATNQLNTLVQLNTADKEIAQKRIDSQISTMFNMANFRQQALNNSREQYQWMASQMGADGLYNSLASDPRQLAFAEKILGTGPGGLATLAQTAAADRARKISLENQDLALKRESVSQGWANISLQRQKLAAEIDAMAGKSDRKIAGQVDKATAVTGKINEALGLVKPTSTGFLGGFSKGVSGTPAYTLDKTLTTIKANLGFDELQKMRDNSPTGGALGQVAIQELESLQSTVASLDVGLPPETLKTNLGQVRKHYQNWLNTVGYELAPDGTVIEIID